MILEDIQKIINDAIDEKVSSCEAYGQLDLIEKLAKSGKVQIRTNTLDEAREFNKGESYYGGSWEIKATGTKLNYDDDENCATLITSLKDRQLILQKAWKSKQDPKNFFDKNYIYIDEDSGEVVDIVSVKTSAGESITFRPAKPKGPKPTDEGKKLIFD